MALANVSALRSWLKRSRRYPSNSRSSSTVLNGGSPLQGSCESVSAALCMRVRRRCICSAFCGVLAGRLG